MQLDDNNWELQSGDELDYGCDPWTSDDGGALSNSNEEEEEEEEETEEQPVVNSWEKGRHCAPVWVGAARGLKVHPDQKRPTPVPFAVVRDQWQVLPLMMAEIRRYNLEPDEENAFLPHRCRLCACYLDGRKLQGKVDSVACGWWVPVHSKHCPLGGPYAVRTTHQTGEMLCKESPEAARKILTDANMCATMQELYAAEHSTRCCPELGAGEDDCRMCGYAWWIHGLKVAALMDGCSLAETLTPDEGIKWAGHNPCKHCKASVPQLTHQYFNHRHIPLRTMKDWKGSLLADMPLVRLVWCGLHGIEYLVSWVISCSRNLLKAKGHPEAAEAIFQWARKHDPSFKSYTVKYYKSPVPGEKDRKVLRDYIIAGRAVKRLFAVEPAKKIAKLEEEFQAMLSKLPQFEGVSYPYQHDEDRAKPVLVEENGKTCRKQV